MIKRKILCFFVLLSLGCFFLHSQNIKIEKIIENVFHVPSLTGNEGNMSSMIRQLLPQQNSFFSDNMGSLYISLGKGLEGTAFLTGMDEHGYFVSGITEDGFLTLDRAVPPPHGLYDGFIFGHPMFVFSESGLVEGVITLPSLHIVASEIRQKLNEYFTLDRAYLDIGVRSRADVEDRGIKYLDPVMPVPSLSLLSGEKMVGNALGRKVCIALLLDLVQKTAQNKPSQKNAVGWLAQSLFTLRSSRPRISLGAYRANKVLTSNRFLILDVYPTDIQSENFTAIGEGPILVTSGGRTGGLAESILKNAAKKKIPIQSISQFNSPLMAAFVAENKAVVGLFLPVKYAATPAETISLLDVGYIQELLSSVFINNVDAHS